MDVAERPRIVREKAARLVPRSPDSALAGSSSVWLLRPLFEPIIGQRNPVTGKLACNVVMPGPGQRQHRVCFAVRHHDLETGLRREMKNCPVFRQEMHVQRPASTTDRVQPAALKQRMAVAASTAVTIHAQPDLGAGMCRIERKVRDGNQGQTVAKNAEDFVASKVDALDVTSHRFITEAHAETQSAIGHGQPQQMIGNAPALERDELPYDDRAGAALASRP